VSYGDPGEASRSCDAETKGIEGDDDNEPVPDDKNPDWVDHDDPEYDVEYIEEDDDDKVNMEAYDTEDVSSKRANRLESCTLSMDGPSEDTLTMYVLWVLLVSFAHRFRGYIFRETLLRAAPHLQLQVPTTLLWNLSREPLHWHSRLFSPSGTQNTRTLSTPAFGLRTTQVLSSVVPLYTSCRAGFIRTDTMWDLRFLSQLANLQEGRWYSHSSTPNYSGYSLEMPSSC